VNPVIEKTGPEPIYIQAKNWIRGKIASGEWKAKEKLPSESDLAATLGISRGTIKQAIKQLITEGILVQIHGKGTFVVGEQMEYPLAERLISIAETMIESHKDFTTRLLGLETSPADQTVSRFLELDPSGQVYHLKRLRFIEDTPVVFLENFLPKQLFPGFEQNNFEEKTLFSIIEDRYKLRISWGKRSFLGKGADEKIAEMLQIDKGTPITFLEQTIYTEDNVPIEYSKVWLRNDQIKLTSILKRTQ
jgi:DNA-binding GntR family transcriptional regulator